MSGVLSGAAGSLALQAKLFGLYSPVKVNVGISNDEFAAAAPPVGV